MTDLFRCTPLNSVLSRMACGARHDRRIGATCSGCAVGRQHARGALPSTWPDGSEIVTALVTPATLASLKIHLAIIEAHEPPVLRGARILGATIREHAERAGVHPQRIRQRLLRGEPLTEALDLTPRPNDPTRSNVRALALRVHRPPGTVCRWLKRGLTVEAILERCA